ncbi:hypothetical protein [Paenibacillus wynnii]|uniref:hypothetical protein n=1 Tax=Paenibacillus wynnii TaxID=268407 RepID=UPI002793D3D7|nr:hypothetical protein [Paenibacillus wynnii]MDQ0196405.1 hypothetical protein [Paenibacillus wynnii]
MRVSITRGFHSMKEQFYILILLFIYRLLWGYFMYGFVRDAIVPILMRYPNQQAGGSGMSRLLYYIEGQFSLSSDPGVQRWLWMLLAITILKMLLSPFIRAGLIHELHQESKGTRGLFFFPGMKLYGLPVLIFSLVEWLLALLPLYWLAPRIYKLLLSSFLDYSLLLKIIPFLLVWLIYIFIIRLCLLYMQFGYTGGTGMFYSLILCLRHIIPAVTTAAILGAGSFLVLLLCGLTGILCPGLPALLIRQISPLPSTFFKMWGLAAQYHLWQSKLPSNN